MYVKTYLVNELLRTLDTMTMHNSLEARVPLLDHRIVERALQVPARHKMRGGQGKRLLHDIHRAVVGQPPRRRKQGFSLPLEQWMRGPFAGLIDDVVRSSSLRDRGVFDPGAARAPRRPVAGRRAPPRPAGDDPVHVRAVGP